MRTLPVLALLFAGCGARTDAAPPPTRPPHVTTDLGYAVSIVVLDPADIARVYQLAEPESCSPAQGNTIPCGPPDRGHDDAAALQADLEAALQAAGMSDRARVEITARQERGY